jgi:hypothetical protein
LAEQMLELRGLRGKNSSKLRLILQRVQAETQEFENCTSRLQAMRVVHNRMLKDAMIGLSTDRLREEVNQMQTEMNASLLNLGARKAFVAMCARLRALLTAAQARNDEIREMLGASYARLNAEFGFSLALTKGPELGRFVQELELIERSYVQYLGLTQALRLSQPKFMEQFRRMLVSKLRVVFENASGDLELWSKGASSQVDAQLREALERVQSAAGELEQRIGELEAQDQRLQQFLVRATELIEALREHACAAPATAPAERRAVDLALNAEPAAAPLLRLVQA